jgi:aldose 1-epimerase
LHRWRSQSRRPVRQHRIAKGTFKLNGTTYTVPINNGVNSLHGGLVGFGNHIWSQVGGLVKTKSEVGVTLQLVSPNGDSSGAKGSPGCADGCTGYPGELTVDVTFTLNNAGQYALHYQAHNDSSTLSTVVNLTNHSYFNLAGENSVAGSAYGQYVQINANRYSPTDTTQIPLPGLPDGASVAGTPFDFRTPHTIGSRIDDVSAPDNVPARARASCSSPRATTTTGFSTSRRRRPRDRTGSTWPPVPGTWPAGAS